MDRVPGDKTWKQVRTFFMLLFACNNMEFSTNLTSFLKFAQVKQQFENNMKFYASHTLCNFLFKPKENLLKK